MENRKILIVDDDQTLINILVSRVSSFGFEVDTALDGREAAAILKKKSFPLVLTDMMMPGMDGMELLQHIRANYPETQVIVMTGFRDHYSYSDVINAGAIDFIEKPIYKEELHAKLDRVVREQEMRRQLAALQEKVARMEEGG